MGVSAAMGGQAYGPMESSSGAPPSVAESSSMESGSLGGSSGRGQVLGTGRSGTGTGAATNEVPSALELPGREDPAEAAALAAERRMAARSK